MIPALVLTAGLGTRLRPLSYVRAKGALPLAGEPLARRILRWLHEAGVRDAVLNLHHLPHTLTRAVGDGSDLGLRVRYSWESPVLGSAGGPRRALPLLRAAAAASDGSFLIVNGDTVTNVDIGALLAHHRATEALVTLAVIPNTAPHKYSGLAVDDDGRVTGVVRVGAMEPSFHFIGVQVAEPRAFASVPLDTPYESVGRLYPALIAAQPGSVRAFLTPAEFLDIGTASDYLDTALRIEEREGPSAGARTRIGNRAHVDRSVLWDDVVVEEGAMLRECIVADGVVVPADTSWRGVTLRVAQGELAPGERIVDGLAVCALDRHPEGVPGIPNDN